MWPPWLDSSRPARKTCLSEIISNRHPVPLRWRASITWRKSRDSTRPLSKWNPAAAFFPVNNTDTHTLTRSNIAGIVLHYNTCILLTVNIGKGFIGGNAARGCTGEVWGVSISGAKAFLFFLSYDGGHFFILLRRPRWWRTDGEIVNFGMKRETRALIRHLMGGV